MSSIGKRLLATTADLAATIEARSSPGAEGTKPPLPRTAPGQMLAARTEMLALQGELQALREKLKSFDGSLPTVKLDPQVVDVTRWANRHASAFATASFARLKSSIELAGGNTQPILVRRSDKPGRYEIVFGHRRHRACLELGLPVLAVLWEGEMPDLDLFLSMDRENREREDPSAYEQGITYLAALEAGLFPSQRRLAEAIGVSHTWVRKATQVAQLPPAIVETFAAPLDIQPRHAEEIAQALDQDRKAVLRRAERLRQMSRRPSPGQIVAHLVGRKEEPSRAAAEKLHVNGRLAGTWRRDNRGRAVLTLEAHAADEALLAQLSDALLKLLKKAES